MVSVAADKWIRPLLDELREQIVEQNVAGSLEGLFAAHVLNQVDAFPIGWRVNCDVTWAKGCDISSAPNVSALGYTYSATQNSDIGKVFASGFERITKRDVFSGGHLSLASQPCLLVGLALGVKVLPTNDAQLVWFRSVMTELEKQTSRVETNDPLYLYLNYLVFDNKVNMPSFQAVDFYELAAYIWLIQQGYAVNLEAQAYRSLIDEFLSQAVAQPTVENAYQAAIGWRSLHSTLVHVLADSKQDTLARILSNIQLGLRRWRWDSLELKKPIRWPIRTEREFQDIVWLVLSGYFTEIQDEQTLPKFGHSSYTADFGISSIGTLIEAKFARKKTDLKAIEKEILQDSVPYLSSSIYNDLVVVIYDDSCSIQEHEITRSALLQVDGIISVVFINRPSQLPPCDVQEIKQE